MEWSRIAASPRQRSATGSLAMPQRRGTVRARPSRSARSSCSPIPARTSMRRSIGTRTAVTSPDTHSAGQHPFVTRDAAEYLAKARVALVGIDSLNIDDDKDGSRPAHTILLGGGVAIVEHMTNLAALPDAGFRFFAVPPRVKGMGSFPVRAFARVDR